MSEMRSPEFQTSSFAYFLKALEEPLFLPGLVRASPGFMSEEIPEDWFYESLARHVSGDWGELDPENLEANDAAIKTGARIMSVYRYRGKKVWVITDAGDSKNRDGTMFLLPEEY